MPWCAKAQAVSFLHRNSSGRDVAPASNAHSATVEAGETRLAAERPPLAQGSGSPFDRFRAHSFRPRDQPEGQQGGRGRSVAERIAIVSKGRRPCENSERSRVRPNFEPYRLAEPEKSQKFSLCTAVRNLSLSFRTAPAESAPTRVALGRTGMRAKANIPYFNAKFASPPGADAKQPLLVAQNAWLPRRLTWPQSQRLPALVDKVRSV